MRRSRIQLSRARTNSTSRSRPASETGRPGLEEAGTGGGRGKWRDGFGGVEPAVLVELPGQRRLEVVTGQLRLGEIHHADGALEARGRELLPERVPGRVPERQQKGRDPGLVADPRLP